MGVDSSRNNQLAGRIKQPRVRTSGETLPDLDHAVSPDTNVRHAAAIMIHDAAAANQNLGPLGNARRLVNQNRVAGARRRDL